MIGKNSIAAMIPFNLAVNIKKFSEMIFALESPTKAFFFFK